MSSTEGDVVVMTTTTTTSSVTDEDDVRSDDINTNKQQEKVLRSSNSNNVENAKTDEEEVKTNANNEASPEQSPSCLDRMWKFFTQHEFLVLVVIGICLAKVYPPLGAVYLHPEITATWLAVMFIFFLSGIVLKTEEFKKAFQQVHVHLFVQVFNFGVDTVFVFGVSKALLAAGALSEPLANGLIVCTTVSMSINMVQILTKVSGGDEAGAIFNAVTGNTLGVVVSPLLILGYLGVTADIAMGHVFWQLAVRVVVPLLLGQIVRKLCPIVVYWSVKYKDWFKRGQAWSLAFIIYTVFCVTFLEKDDAIKGSDIAVMVAVVVVCIIFLMIFAWACMRLLFRDKPTFRVMGLFACTHKTIAMGVPLIQTIYNGDPHIGLITLPLLIWHTANLIIGSCLTTRLARWVEQEEKRIAATAANVVTTKAEQDIENSRCALNHPDTDVTKVIDSSDEDGSCNGCATSATKSRFTFDGQSDEENA